jgi:mannose-6-phosphate isomerase-like protein (cupin superfamily)
MKPIVLFLLTVALASTAGDPAGFHMWKASELQSFSKTLAPKLNGKSILSEPLAGERNYSFSAVLRTASGEAEVHETKADVFVVQSGEATLVVGGKVEGARKTQPNEVRGSGISGGVEKRLEPGDVVTIPPKTPHQMKVAAGKEVAYLAMKIAE